MAFGGWQHAPASPPEDWTPRELRHGFASLLSDSGMPLDKIALLVGHSGTQVTEKVYRQQIRPVIQDGAQAMDLIFPNPTRASWYSVRYSLDGSGPLPSGGNGPDLGYRSGKGAPAIGLEPITCRLTAGCSAD